MQQHLISTTSEDELNHKIDIALDLQQSKRREIVRTLVRFAEERSLNVNWLAAVRYVLYGESTVPIIFENDGAEND